MPGVLSRPAVTTSTWNPPVGHENSDFQPAILREIWSGWAVSLDCLAVTEFPGQHPHHRLHRIRLRVRSVRRVRCHEVKVAVCIAASSWATNFRRRRWTLVTHCLRIRIFVLVVRLTFRQILHSGYEKRNFGAQSRRFSRQSPVQEYTFRPESEFPKPTRMRRTREQESQTGCCRPPRGLTQD